MHTIGDHVIECDGNIDFVVRGTTEKMQLLRVAL